MRDLCLNPECDNRIEILNLQYIESLVRSLFSEDGVYENIRHYNVAVILKALLDERKKL